MGDGDLRTRGAVYHLTAQAWERIVPELSMSEQCSFMAGYLFDCLILNPKSEDYVYGGFEAAWELASWLKHLEGREGGGIVITQVARRLTEAYLASDETTRNRIETGAVEHILESKPLRKYFESWASDPVLGKAYELCLEWGQAHESEP
jgi:hypothetical protein